LLHRSAERIIERERHELLGGPLIDARSGRAPVGARAKIR
jgi:hypothetical protein